MFPQVLLSWQEFHPSQDELTRKLSNVQVVLDGKKLVDMVVGHGQNGQDSTTYAI